MKSHLCHIFYAFNFGGPEVRTATIINAAGADFRHTIISLNGDLACQEKIYASAEVSYARVQHRTEPFGYTKCILQIVREINPDLLITHGWGGIHGILAAELYGRAPLLHAEDGFLPEEAQRQKLRRLLARRFLLRKPKIIVCPSQTLVQIARTQWWLPADKIRYIPNGVDIAHFSPGPGYEVRQRLGVGVDEVVVGTVSRLRPEKNHERLLRAFASAVASGLKARLLIVGDGPCRESLQLMAQDLGLGTDVIFNKGVADPAEFLQAMDIFALSSDTEQMPFSVLEAMSVGLPLVCTAVGDLPIMVAPENVPHIHPPTQEDAFSASLAQLITRPERRDTLGRANRERCRREFSLGTMTQTYANLYRSLLAPVNAVGHE